MDYFIIHLICYSVPESTLMHERQKVENLKFNHYLKLDMYVMDVKGYYPYLHELTNDILKFKPEHLQAANKILNELNPNQNIMISIHVRLTDIEKHIKNLFNVEYTTDDYFKRAMAYFQEKYGVITFIQRNFKNKNLIVPNLKCI